MGRRLRGAWARCRSAAGGFFGSVRRHPFGALFVAGVVVLVLLLVLPVTWVRWTTRDSTYSVDAVPPAPVAIVFGAGLGPTGLPTAWLEARLRVAADLYRKGRVRVILVSGDHGTVGHDETGAMTRWLVAHGIPASKVVGDHAGFDTYDSCQRAHRIFGVDKAIVVTQGFHVPRAVFLCRQAGIHSVAVAAAAEGGTPGMNAAREGSGVDQSRVRRHRRPRPPLPRPPRDRHRRRPSGELAARSIRSLRRPRVPGRWARNSAGFRHWSRQPGMYSVTASVGEQITTVSIVILVVCVPLIFLGRFLMQSGAKRSRDAVARATPEAKQMSDEGASPDDIAVMLLTEHGVSPGGAMRVLCDVLRMTAPDALAVVHPHLSERQQDLFDRMPTAKLEAMLARA